MKTTKELLGSRIKEIRRLRGLSQEVLAEMVDIDPKHLSRIEVGQSFPSFNTLDRLANALDVELKEFFEFDHRVPTLQELKETLDKLLEGIDEERMRLVVKVVRAVVK